jgi:hypothetical protein
MDKILDRASQMWAELRKGALYEYLMLYSVGTCNPHPGREQRQSQ